MDSQWLQSQFLHNPGKSKAGLASHLGLDPPAISKILSGTRQIKAQEYVRMRQFFGLPSDGEAALSTKPSMQAKNPASELRDKPPAPSEWTIPLSMALSSAQAPGTKTRIFEVRDSLMVPDFSRGEYVVVNLSDKKPEPPGIFMLSDGHDNMLRYCELLQNDEMKISARADDFEPQILKPGYDFLILGRVVAKLQMI